MPSTEAPRVLGRYLIHGELASGGMATVHLARLVGPGGFSRTVAVKRLHPQYAKDPEFVAMFLDEARLAVRIQHPNVAQVLDVVAEDGELFLVMEYLHGDSVARLMKRWKDAFPLDVAVSVVSGALHGLHAAHTATNERGEPLGIVHRDVSPQNLFTGRDGVTRVLDFGVAKAVDRLHTTEDGKVKGKLAYMAPEQVRGSQVTARTDVYAASVVLWELLTGKRFAAGTHPGEIVEKVLSGKRELPSKLVAGVPPAIDRIVLQGMDADPAKRFPTARAMALALEAASPPALASRVGAWVEDIAGEELTQRAERLASIESESDSREMKALMHEIIGVQREKSGSEAKPVAAAPGGSGKSEVSLAISQDPSREKRPSRAPAVLAALGLLALGASGAWLFGWLQKPKTEPVPTSVASTAPPAAATHVPVKSDPPPLPVASNETPIDSGIAEKPREKPSAKPVRTKKTDCSVPYTLDANGKKKYKMECL
jgi:serine/threonine-protein kinase